MKETLRIMKSANIRTIQSKSELPEGAAYYINEYERKGNDHLRWTAIYDLECNLLENVTVKYTDAISGLRRIIKKKDVEREKIWLSAYDLEPLNNEYMLVSKNDDTGRTLEAAANAVSK